MLLLNAAPLMQPSSRSAGLIVGPQLLSWQTLQIAASVGQACQRIQPPIEPYAEKRPVFLQPETPAAKWVRAGGSIDPPPRLYGRMPGLRASLVPNWRYAPAAKPG